MNEPFGKFYAKTFTGSMRGAGSHVIALMAYAVANARPPEGDVEINEELAAFQIGDSVERIREALDYLQAPDDRSRHPEHDGRRLVKVGAFRYRLVNFKVYRDGTDIDARRKYWRDRQQASRSKRTQKQVRSRSESREKRFVNALERGDEESSGRIAAEDL